MPDVFDELVGTGASPQELVAQLRKQRALGQIGALSGDKSIAALGGGVAQDALGEATDIRNRHDKAQSREDQQAFSKWQQEQSIQGRNDDRQFKRDSLAQARAIAEQQMANARDIAGLKYSGNRSANLSPFEKARQGDLGKESAQWDATGKVQTQSAMADLDNAIGMLEKNKNIGNSYSAWLPDYIRAKTDPEGLHAQQLANRVSVNRVREALGSQFTQQESEKYQSLGYNPNLDNATNLANLKSQKAIIETVARRKNALFEGLRGPDNLPQLENDDIDTMDDDTLATRLIQQAQARRGK